MIIQMRIFIEAILILVIMTGYRESVIGFVKYFYMKIRNPKKTYKDLEKSMSTNKVSTITLFSKRRM